MVHKMKTLEEVLYDYTRGEKTLEEANNDFHSHLKDIYPKSLCYLHWMRY